MTLEIKSVCYLDMIARPNPQIRTQLALCVRVSHQTLAQACLPPHAVRSLVSWCLRPRWFHRCRSGTGRSCSHPGRAAPAQTHASQSEPTRAQQAPMISERLSARRVLPFGSGRPTPWWVRGSAPGSPSPADVHRESVRVMSSAGDRPTN